MASGNTADCFHDNSDDADDSSIADVEWCKLKSSHLKEGYRDGYSAGQEAVLQQAFNQGFAQRVKLETRSAFHRGILMALKTFSEKSRNPNRQNPKISLSVGHASRIETLLAELDSITAETDSTEGTTPRVNDAEIAPLQTDLRTDVDQGIFEAKQVGRCGDSEFSGSQCLRTVPGGASADERTACPEEELDRTKYNSLKEGCLCKAAQPSGSIGLSTGSEGTGENEGASCCKSRQSDNHERSGSVCSSTPSGNQVMSHSSEGGIAEDQMSCCNPGGTCQSNILGGTPDGGMSCSNSKMTQISRNCQHLLKELGIEDFAALELV